MVDIDVSDPKAVLHRYLRAGRDALLWKLDGLSEYDIRRPLTPTGTNLLGLVRHTGSVEAGYLGDCMGRPFGEPFPWFDDGAEPNADLFVEAEVTREEVLGLFERCTAHADATIDALPLDAPGTVPWWPDEMNPVPLHLLLVHLVAEYHRHAGHADIVRELVDGAVGYRSSASNLPDVDDTWWAGYRARVEAEAVAASDSS